MGHAMELVLTSRIVEAPEALAIGLVNRVVPRIRCSRPRARSPRRLAACDPDALAIAKRALHAGAVLDLAGAMANERAANLELRERKAKRGS
jgi:enoyl-CoA hydratase/carnithine racemase